MMPPTTPGALLAAAGDAARSFHDLVPGVTIDTRELERVAAVFRATGLTAATPDDVLAAAAAELRQRQTLTGSDPHTRRVDVAGAISYVLYGTVTPPGSVDDAPRPVDVLYRDTLTVLTRHLGIPTHPGTRAYQMAVAVSEWSARHGDDPGHVPDVLDRISGPRVVSRDPR